MRSNAANCAFRLRSLSDRGRSRLHSAQYTLVAHHPFDDGGYIVRPPSGYFLFFDWFGN
jgi:hypothetical protein